MSRWMTRQLARLRDAPAAPAVVVLDTIGVLPRSVLAEFGANSDPRLVFEARDWWALRCAWEQAGRGARWERRCVIHALEAAAHAASTPADIRDRADVVEIGWPVPPPWRPLFVDLFPEPGSDVMVDAAAAGLETPSMLEKLWGVPIPVGSEGGELSAVAQLRARPTLPDAAWGLIAQSLTTPLASAVAQQPPDAQTLNSSWGAWLRGQHVDAIDDAGPAMLGLVAAGLLPRPAAVPTEGPRWLRLASGHVDHAARVRELLATPPVEQAPTTLDGWSGVAVWFGELRAALSQSPNAPADLKATVRRCAERLDWRFVPWLQAHYGTLLQSSATPPVTLNKVAPFLARRLREGERVLLIVLDGVGLAHWQLLRDLVPIRPLQEQACVALLPTETAISRQSLVSGEMPDEFKESLTTTRREERRWRNFWHAEGVKDADVRYYRVDGRPEDDVALSPMSRAVVVIVSAVDKLMHSTHLLDDVQLTAQITPWAEQGFLRRLLDDAASSRFETWLTADHGNVVAAPGAAPREGLKLERAGTRFRLYRSEAQRDSAGAPGVAWTPPRLPPDVHVLFPPGLEGFHSGYPRVTHGGMSLQEVFVPLVRVT